MSRKLRTSLLAAALIMLAVVVSGCAGSGTRAALTGASWPGVAVYDDAVYVAGGPQVYAIDPNNGSTLWVYPVELKRGQSFYAVPAVADDIVVVADYTDTLAVLDRATGREIWTFTSRSSRFIGGAVIGDNLIYAGTVDGTVYALNRETGSTVWTYGAARDIWSTPLLDGDTLYVTSLDKYLYALDAASGNLLWKFPRDGSDLSPEEVGAMVGTPTLYEGVLYFGSFGNHIYALDTATQQLLWTFDTANWVWGSPALDVDSGLLVGGDLDGHVYALDRETGELVWPFDTQGPVVSTPAIGEKDGEPVVYVASGDTKLYTLRLADGSPAAASISIQAEFSAFLSGTSERPIPIYAPPILYNGLVLIAVHQGNYPVYAFDQETLLERWHYQPPQS